ncbi:MAG: hypothetical protein AAF773_01565 [Cyanobacteria bacterium P01_D01_bin.115]
MASLTRTVHSGGQSVQTITGSDGSVTQRVLEAQSRRVEAQVASNAQEPLITWNGNGRIKPVGANNSYRPRGVQANGGLGKGDPVQLNGGLVSATPSGGGNSTELQSQIKAQAETLAKTIKALPGQIGEGDPNTETTPGTKDVLPRYPGDFYFQASKGVTYAWDSDQEAQEPDPRWVPLFVAGLRNGNSPPTPSGDNLIGYYDGELYYDAGTGALWRWDADPSTDPPSPSWVCVAQSWNLGSGTPADESVFIDGAIAVSGDKIYTGSVANGWSELSAGGGGIQTSYLLVRTLSNPSSGAVAMQFQAFSGVTFDQIGANDGNDDEKILLPSAGVYEIQVKLSASCPGIIDNTYTGTWAFSCNLYNASGIQVAALPASGHPTHGNNAPGDTPSNAMQNARDTMYPTFWFDTTANQAAYATVFISYSLSRGGAPESQPSNATYQGRLMVKKLS